MRIGDKNEIDSNSYGIYVTRCIALVDLVNGNPLNKSSIDIEQAMEWMEHYHPKSFFHSYGFKKFEDNNWKFYISIALERDNMDWAKNNPNCEYIRATKGKNKKLPIAISDKDLAEWMKHSSAFLVESIDV